MKNQTKIVLLSLAILCTALAITYCGGSSTSYTLSNAPAGFVFTNTSGNTITSATGSTEVQLRDASGKVLLQFTIGSNVDFSNIVAERNTTNTIVHFPSAADKSGLTGTVVMFVPCDVAVTQVRVCPQACAMNQVGLGCTGELALTAAAPTSGNYTWDNPATRTATDDCQISASVDAFGTGGFGLTDVGPVLTADDFPTVGVCATGTVDIMGDAFQAALAAATSFTFMHQPYVTDANIPFICGKQGSWDPSVAGAFDATTSLNMTDALADQFNLGGGSHYMLCNTGFEFATGNVGFHDATTYRGELKFTSGGTTYRGRVRFTVTGTDAGKTLASLGITSTLVTLADMNGTTLATVGDVRDLLAANPINVTVNAVASGTTRITASGGFICVGTE